jgi:hypothetical protein
VESVTVAIIILFSLFAVATCIAMYYWSAYGTEKAGRVADNRSAYWEMRGLRDYNESLRSELRKLDQRIREEVENDRVAS